MNAPLNQKTVLIVDDEPEIAEAVQDILTHAGYACEWRADGAAALAFLAEHPQCDAILLDLQMPGMDGPAFRAAQLKDERLAAIPTMLMTAAPDAAATASLPGIRGLLRKPFRAATLVASLVQLWGETTGG